MISKPSFNDRTLPESFYRALVNRFCESFSSSIEELLDECNFGIAPNPAGVKTFFIMAPSLDVAEQLIENIDSILNRVSELLVGVEQTAICLVPPESQIDNPGGRKEVNLHPPKFMLGKIFPHTLHRLERNLR